MPGRVGSHDSGVLFFFEKCLIDSGVPFLMKKKEAVMRGKRCEGGTGRM